MSASIKQYLEPEFWQSNEVSQFSENAIHLASVSLPLGAVIFQTSGSSGKRKWVVHTRQSLLYSSARVVEHLSVGSSDVWFLALPIYHVGGFGVLARAYLSSCGISHYQDKWNAESAMNKMHNDAVTLCSLVPTQLVDIVRVKLKCPHSLRAVIVGGGRLNHKVKQQAVDLGWPILESYGMTETGSQIATQLDSSDTEIPLISGWQVCCSAEAPLKVKGEGLLTGYLNESDSGFEFSDPKSADGWFSTSDIVKINEISNSLVFHSRNDRQVKILGELVCLDQLEHRLMEICGVSLLVVDIPDERRGVKLVPVIELLDQSRLDVDLLQLPGLYRLEPVFIIETFPRNSMGKLDRRRLRESVVFSAE